MILISSLQSSGWINNFLLCFSCHGSFVFREALTFASMYRLFHKLMTLNVHDMKLMPPANSMDVELCSK